MDPKASVADALSTASYSALKAEQTARIALRDNYVLTYIGSVAALFLGVVTTKNLWFIPAVPAVGFVALHAYASNDHRIGAIRNFLRGSLPPSIASAWEHSHGVGKNARRRSIARIVAAFVLFVGPSAAGLVIITQSSLATAYKVSAAGLFAGYCASVRWLYRIYKST
ncbi:hypothetical protein [Pseudosporangium ferrugineum]|uniref:hypothetical protein n=1 Tax=Pseudosporangium ferrugineum TaxID=439699 RepID=UPI0011B2558E|nr:hypothetical protein [Pseudosporangium ferrugineum]